MEMKALINSAELAKRIIDCISDGYDDEENRGETENLLYNELSQLNNDSLIEATLIRLCETIEELDLFQGKYGFSIGKKRYRINTENALDALEDKLFSDEELKIMSDGILALIHNVNEAIRLTVDEKAKDALYEANRRYRELNSKICNL